MADLTGTYNDPAESVEPVIEGTAYGVGWDSNEDAPTKNAVYDKMETKADKSNVLELDNTDAFTPDADYEPATKKYVDDNAGGAPEGTAVKSTGETGGTKFLREDGDGTCSWQTPAGGSPTVATGAEVDTGTDNTKMVTPKAMEDSSYTKLALGETSSTAYRGDRGKTAYDHSQVAHAATDADNTASVLGSGAQIDKSTIVDGNRFIVLAGEENLTPSYITWADFKALLDTLYTPL